MRRKGKAAEMGRGEKIRGVAQRGGENHNSKAIGEKEKRGYPWRSLLDESKGNSSPSGKRTRPVYILTPRKGRGIEANEGSRKLSQKKGKGS